MFNLEELEWNPPRVLDGSHERSQVFFESETNGRRTRRAAWPWWRFLVRDSGDRRGLIPFWFGEKMKIGRWLLNGVMNSTEGEWWSRSTEESRRLSPLKLVVKLLELLDVEKIEDVDEVLERLFSVHTLLDRVPMMGNEVDISLGLDIRKKRKVSKVKIKLEMKVILANEK